MDGHLITRYNYDKVTNARIINYTTVSLNDIFKDSYIRDSITPETGQQ